MHEITTPYTAAHIFYEGGSATLDNYSVPWFQQLQEGEVRTFCTSAYQNGTAQLEDNYNNKLTLVYNSDDETYKLRLRDDY